MAETGIIKCSSYDREEITEKVKILLDMTGADKFKNKKLLLKPNILYAETPEKAVTTHPEFFRAVITYFQNNGNKIFAGDSPAYQNQNYAGRKSRLKDTAEECGAVWVDFSESRQFDVPEGKLVKSFLLANILAETDAVISLPKMKTHELMYYTGGMKNLFGLVPGLNKSGLHLRFPDKDNFAEMIVDLNLAVKPAFAVMDAVTAMEGHGPGSGTPRAVNLLIASSNILALDITASSIMGYDPMEIPILKKAMERRYWLAPEEKIRYIGEDPKDLIIKDYKLIKKLKDISIFKNYMPYFLFKFLKELAVKKPVFNREKCVMCRECINICPASALSTDEKGKYIKPDYKKCIKCYCCHEICSNHAIELKRKFF